MADPLQIRVYERQQLVFSEVVDGLVELGRQCDGEEGPHCVKRESDRWRVVVAPLNEVSVSRKQALVESLSDGRIRLTNLSLRVPVRLTDGGELSPNASLELSGSAVLTLGSHTVRVESFEEEKRSLQGLEEAPQPPGFHNYASTWLSGLKLPQAGEQVELLVRWLRLIFDVFNSAASSSDFFPRAAQAVVDIVGLDSGRVLTLEQGEWVSVAQRNAPGVEADRPWQPSRQVLSPVRQDKRTLWQVPERTGTQAASLTGVEAVVAAPILDRHGEVIGALYGERRRPRGSEPSPEITKLEAMLVELLASGVAAGLSRLEQEQAALAARIQFEQFFTPELARQIAARPDLLQGQDVEVTVMFCDIRGFSRVSERLGPAGTVEWIGNVLGTLSECVQNNRGVLIDYIGDELMAMWGTPEEQPDHARLACRAANDILEKLPELNNRWLPILKEPMDLGIGISTGIARVGNTGTQRKFKYGPLGGTVNLASRVQGATKYLKVRLLVTGATFAQLDSSFPARRLCKVRVVNIAELVDIYELLPAGQPFVPNLARRYEAALEEFERNELRKATRILGALLTEHPNDGPALVLLSRAVNGLVEPTSVFDPVWELPGK